MAVRILEKKKEVYIDEHEVEKILGQPLSIPSMSGHVGVVGVAVGLAWTEIGGEVMLVEAEMLPCIGERRDGRLEVQKYKLNI